MKHQPIEAFASFTTVLLGGLVASGIRVGFIPDMLTTSVFLVVLIGGLGLSKPRQPHTVLYQPRGFATRLLKWVSAPQVEAAILWWFGIGLIVHPHLNPHFGGIAIALGWIFLILGWFLVVRLPDPIEFTLIVSTRLCLTLLVAVDAVRLDTSFMVLGAYIGSVLHGLLAMLVHWTLSEVAVLVLDLQQEVRDLKA